MNQTLKCICLDDEPLALEVLESHISRIPALTLMRKTTNAMEAMEAIRREKPDLIFCDIQMPEISGLEFVSQLKDENILIIFTTAHQEHALEAFELNAIDYLLKPVSFERFEKAVNKAIEYFSFKNNQTEEKIEVEDGHIFVKTDQKLQKISFNDIFYIEAFADYVKIWLSPEKRIVTLQTMKKMEGFLPKDRFIRIHRSFIVALDKINSVSGSEVSVLGKSLPVGKNYKDEFLKIFRSKNVIQ